MEDDRCIKNQLPLRTLPASPRELLVSTLEELLKSHPVPESYQNDMQKGIFSGHTSLVFLLLQISSLHPDVTVLGHDLRHWAREYLKPACVPELALRVDYAGLHSEKMSVDLIRACLSGKEEDVGEFLSSVPAFLGPYDGDDPCMAEMFYGRSGVLYMLRFIKHMVPSSASAVEPLIESVAEEVMKTYSSGGWKFVNNRYLGPAHGDIGIITQLVLSRPSLAPRLSDQLEELLSLQLPDGNWPKSDAEQDKGGEALVQFCHGAPGFVICLRTLRPFFPGLHDRIDGAITKGLDVIWDRGLLKKEPNICHGILGNALALPRGPQRDHFLAHATPMAVQEAREKDPSMFKKACYTAEISPFLNYLPSAAWVWAVCETENPPVISFNDV